MSQHSTIEWTDATWSPTTGCSRASPGCAKCYAVRDAWRMGHNLNPKISAAYSGLVIERSNGQLDWSGEVRQLPSRLALPLTWKHPRRIFVNSVSDLWHEDVPASYIADVFAVMHQAHWHQYQILTKRSERLHALAPMFAWPAHIWQGVSVESTAYQWRIDHLRDTPCAIKFLSLEPLLGPLPPLNLTGIDLVIVGGESGPGARPMQPAWVRAIRDQCREAGVCFFFKQWGGVHKKATGRLLDGRTWDEMPLPRGTFQLPLFA
jgi:protein gp37